MTIYFDNNATTRLDPRVLEAMLPLLTDSWGNVGSHHRIGGEAAALVNRMRRAAAEALAVSPRDLVFAASGTEADNLAVRGVVGAAMGRRHVITTAVEHPAVLETCQALAAHDECELTILPVDREGRLDLDELEAELRPGETCLVSAMAANNETGVIFPSAEIGARAHAAGARFHVDAVQAAGKIPLDFEAWGADLISLSAHKIHGPKGVGLLIVRGDVALEATITGGGQERGRRSGTENPAGIVGMSMALQLAVEGLDQSARVGALRDRLAAGLGAKLPGLQVSAAGSPRVPNTLHFTLPGVEADALLTLLDREGIACSSGSACSTGSLEPSHVLAALGVAPDRIHGAVRLSLSRETTDDEVDRAIETVPPLALRLSSLTDRSEG